MKKKISLSIFIMFAVVVNLYVFSDKAISQEVKSNSVVNSDSLISDSKIVVYYFHTTFRCVSCGNIEQHTKEALEKFFFDEIVSGKIDFQVVNIEEPQSKHFVQDYKLYTKSVVLSKVSNGKEIKFKNLDKVWNLLRNKNKFYEYIKDEVNNFIK